MKVIKVLIVEVVSNEIKNSEPQQTDHKSTALVAYAAKVGLLG